MLGLFKERKPRQTGLLKHHIDSPSSDLHLDRPELLVSGWMTFSKDVNPADVDIRVFAAGREFPVARRTRTDVEQAFPDTSVVGYLYRFDLHTENLIEPGREDQQIQLKASWANGSADFNIDFRVEPGFLEADSYFRTDKKAAHTTSVSSEQVEHWTRRGYLVLPGFYSDTEIDAVNADIDDAWQNNTSFPGTITVDQYIGTDREKRLQLRETDPAIRSQPYKLNDMYLESAAIREVVLSERLRAVLEPLIGGPPIICNSLSFERGSQQPDHFDTFYMPPLTRNRMLATWVALEDAHEDAGPLRYYPGSHQLAPFRFRDGTYNLTSAERPAFDEYISDELRRNDISDETFSARKGDVFIWHAHLLHGGLPINDPERTRRSVVTHYFSRDDWSADQYTEFSAGRYYLNR